MQNNNQAIVRKITGRALHSDRRRNFFIIAAIALTTLLIGSVFSIGVSLLESIKINQIRFIGSVGHAAVGHPSASQMERLNHLDYVRTVGTGNSVGFVRNTPQMGKISLSLHYFDKTEWEELRSPAYVDIEGSYPQDENEIMVSRWLLEKLGIENPSIGMEIPVTYYTDIENSDLLITQEFRLSGWFTSFSFIKSLNTADLILVSQALSEKCGKTLENDGSATVIFDDPSRVLEYCDMLIDDLGLSEGQPAVPAQGYDIDKGQAASTGIALSAIVIFLIFTGYLLIYNVLYISVSRDVRFYGLLKTLGTTPRQIKKIVVGQIVELCLIGIPVGLSFALLFSYVFVPGFISKLKVVSTEAVVSFSPFIYLGAAFFALLTAVLGAMNPAKKAARISPIEAQKYTGEEVKKSRTHSFAQGKPYKMAFRNIFRDKKRAGIVLLSLFLGMNTFLSVTTLVLSMNMDRYVESIYESDFILKNNLWTSQKFDDAFIKNLKSLPGFEGLETTTLELIHLEYSPEAFGDYISDLHERESLEGWTEEDIYENFRGFIAGIPDKTLVKLNETIDEPIDIEAFQRGEFALIATDCPGLFSNVAELFLTPLSQSGPETENDFGEEKIVLPIGGYVPLSFKNIGSGLAPTLFVSNTLMSKWYEDPVISQINIDVSEEYEQYAFNILRQATDREDEISLASKIESMEELNNAKMALYVLGGGISLVIASIGILNFVNVMSVSVMVRKRELAALESIGMSRRQIRKLLVSEGLGYAMITILLILSIGNAVTYGIFKLFQRQASYAIFTYPLMPMIVIILMILAICLITPEIAYRSIGRMTLVERLREAE